jgi:zinc and cadmium transporter
MERSERIDTGTGGPTVDDRLLTILGFGLAMSAIALVGGLLALAPDRLLRRALPPTVAFAAGALVAGAFLFMLPRALEDGTAEAPVLEFAILGFTIMLALDQLLEWHHCHRPPGHHVRPLGPLLLVADGLHNLLGGLAIGSLFVIDLRAGIAAWIAAALHELPQEFGDFGAIVQAGFSRRRALLYNFLSALTFPIGAVAAWALDGAGDLRLLVALGAGNFVYIAAADLIPEVKRSPELAQTTLRFVAFVTGVMLLWVGRAMSS